MNKIKKFISDTKECIANYIHKRRIRRLIKKYDKHILAFKAAADEYFDEV